MNRPLRADTVRSGDISKFVVLLMLLAAIIGLALWAFVMPRPHKASSGVQALGLTGSASTAILSVTRGWNAAFV